MNKITRIIPFFLCVFLLLGCSQENLPAPQISSMTMLDNNVGWIIAKHGQIEKDHLIPSLSEWGKFRSILRTTDGGNHWINVTPKAIKDRPFYHSARYIALDFIDSNHGWIVSSSYGSSVVDVFSTSDGGQTWNQTSVDPRYTYPSSNIYSLSFIDQQHGWLSVSPDSGLQTSSGDLYVTEDGGLHWTRLSLPSGGEVYLLSQTYGILNSKNNLFETNDNGQSWKLIASSTHVLNLRDNLFLINTDKIGRFKDASLEYKPVNLPANASGALDFIDEMNGYLVCITDQGNVLFKTNDGGINWYKTNPTGFKVDHIKFITLQLGYGLGDNMLFKTNDGGKTWKKINVGG